MHHWFKSYGDFAEWLDLAYQVSFSGGGFAINGATQSGLEESYIRKRKYNPASTPSSAAAAALSEKMLLKFKD